MKVARDFLQEFYDKSVDKKKFPDFEQFKLVCSSPYRFMRLNMTNGILEDFRFIFLGSFQLNKKRIKYAVDNLEKKFKEGNISETRYLTKKKAFDYGLKRIEEEDKQF